MDRDALEALHEARAAEKEQAAFYRRLAAEAEALGDDALAERLNGLHADEQHHLSRLTARSLVREILEVERQHERHLGGKWTGASRGGAG